MKFLLIPLALVLATAVCWAAPCGGSTAGVCKCDDKVIATGFIWAAPHNNGTCTVTLSDGATNYSASGTPGTYVQTSCTPTSNSVTVKVKGNDPHCAKTYGPYTVSAISECPDCP